MIHLLLLGGNAFGDSPIGLPRRFGPGGPGDFGPGGPGDFGPGGPGIGPGDFGPGGGPGNFDSGPVPVIKGPLELFFHQVLFNHRVLFNSQVLIFQLK